VKLESRPRLEPCTKLIDPQPDSDSSSRSLSPSQSSSPTVHQRTHGRLDSVSYQNEVFNNLEHSNNGDSDDDEAPLKRKEQQDHELSGVQPKHQSRKYLEYYAKQYHLPLPPRTRADSVGRGGDGDNVKSPLQMFQQIKINGRHTTGVNPGAFRFIAKEIMSAIEMRQRYIKQSVQVFANPTAERHIRLARGRTKSPQQEETAHTITNKQLSVDVPYHPPPCELDQSPYTDLKSTELPDSLDWTWKMRHGVIDVKDEDNNGVRCVTRPDTLEFLDNHAHLMGAMSHGTLRTYCWRRLQFLTHKFHLHELLNENLEVKEQKELPHRDFYNCRKVDNHIHAAACMNQKHLLRFIKKTLKTNADAVCRVVDGKPQLLKDVFGELNINPYDLSVDLLDCHADSNVYHRFDKFNSKYNPLGQSVLRELYIKTDNYMNGQFFADIVKQVGQDLEESKYQHAEPRLSIYGRRYDEFEKLAKWATSNDVYSSHIVWLIQIPRIFDIYKKNGQMGTFQEMLHNIFGPIMDATLHPKKHPELSRFLEHVVGFDSVDDESKAETFNFTAETATPDKYQSNENPPYSYYLWYMYANISVINQVRKERGLNTFALRPHCGEAGHMYHTATAFLLAENINHGINLRKSPVMEYLFYLTQIGISMSPMSNNALFLPYSKSPFKEFFQRGQNIALSTDDPLQFHLTKEPLIEEYSVASQVWKLNSVDMCEIAANSVRMSGFKHELKTYWLGPKYREDGVEGNDIRRTNVPDVRITYRFETLEGELGLISSALQDKSPQ